MPSGKGSATLAGMLSTDKRIPELMSVTEAAAALAITRQAVLLRAASGQLPGAKVGETWVFRAAVVHGKGQ